MKDLNNLDQRLIQRISFMSLLHFPNQMDLKQNKKIKNSLFKSSKEKSFDTCQMSAERG